jgi:hypothetical protein
MEQPFLLVGITTTILEWVVLFCYNEPVVSPEHKSGKKIAIIVSLTAVILIGIALAIFIPKESNDPSDNTPSNPVSQNQGSNDNQTVSPTGAPNPYLNDPINQYMVAKGSAKADELGWYSEWYFEGQIWVLKIQFMEGAYESGNPREYSNAKQDVEIYFDGHSIYGLATDYHVYFVPYK